MRRFVTGGGVQDKIEKALHGSSKGRTRKSGSDRTECQTETLKRLQFLRGSKPTVGRDMRDDISSKGQGDY